MHQIVISTLISIGLILGALNTPVSWYSIENWFSDKFGAFVLTDFQSTDLVSSIPTTQSANNTIIEDTFNSIIGTTTNTTITSIANLATIGTITSGTWNADVIATLYGGTGSTTWPSANTLIYASSTNAMLGVPIGTAGQSLQLVNVGGSAGLVPQWQTASINQTSEYDFTGDFSAHASTTWNTATEVASSFFGPLFFSGVSTTTLNFTNSAGNLASSTFLTTDDSGKVSWVKETIQSSISSSTDGTTVTNSNTEDDVTSILIPGGAITENQPVHGIMIFRVTTDGVSAGTLTIKAYYGGTAVMTHALGTMDGECNSAKYYTLEFWISNDTGTSDNETLSKVVNDCSSTIGGSLYSEYGTSAIDSTQDQEFLITAQWSTADTDNDFQHMSSVFEY